MTHDKVNHGDREKKTASLFYGQERSDVALPATATMISALLLLEVFRAVQDSIDHRDGSPKPEPWWGENLVRKKQSVEKDGIADLILSASKKNPSSSAVFTTVQCCTLPL
jgi:hypothetical protein